MSKEVTVFVVDLNPSMAKRHNGRAMSDLDFGMEYPCNVIADKVMSQRKTDLVGVISCRERVEHISPIKQMFLKDIHLLRDELKPLPESKHIDRNTILEGIVEATNSIISKCRNLKYLKNIVVITNNRGIELDSDSPNVKSDLDHIKTQLVNHGIKMWVIGVDLENEETGLNQREDESKEHNEKVLRSIEIDAHNPVFVSAKDAIYELKNPLPKKIRTSRRYYARLTLGNIFKYDDVLNLAVEVYSCTVSAVAQSATSVTAKVAGIAKALEKNPTIVDVDDVASSLTEENSEYLSSKYLCSVEISREYFVDDSETGESKPVYFDQNMIGALPVGPDIVTQTDTEDGFEQVTVSKTYTQHKEIAYRLGNEIVVVPDIEAEFLKRIENGPDSHATFDPPFEEQPSDKKLKFANARLLEIIGFVPAEKVPRWMGISAAQYVVGNKDSPDSVLGLATFAHALFESRKYAIARLNATSGGIAPPSKNSSRAKGYGAGPDVNKQNLKGLPEMRLLVPCLSEGFNGLISVQLPYSDDVRYLQFPPLGYLIRKEGEEEEEEEEEDDDEPNDKAFFPRATKRSSTENEKATKRPRLIFSHDKLLPTEEQQNAMDSFVSSMDLMSAGDKYEGAPTEWGLSEDIRCPKVWRVADVVKSCAIGTSKSVDLDSKILSHAEKEATVIKSLIKDMFDDKTQSKIIHNGKYPKSYSDTRGTVSSEAQHSTSDWLDIPPVPDGILKYSKPPPSIESLSSKISQKIELLFGTDREETKEEKRQRLAREREVRSEYRKVDTDAIDLDRLLYQTPEQPASLTGSATGNLASTVKKKSQISASIQPTIPALEEEGQEQPFFRKIKRELTAMFGRLQILPPFDALASRQNNAYLAGSRPLATNAFDAILSDLTDISVSVEEFVNVGAASKGGKQELNLMIPLLETSAEFISKLFEESKAELEKCKAGITEKSMHEQMKVKFGEIIKEQDLDSIGEEIKGLSDWVEQIGLTL